MADNFNIPDSFNPLKKVITTPRTIVTIARTQVKDRVTRAIIQTNIVRKEDFFKDAGAGTSVMFGTPVFDQLIIKTDIDALIHQEQTGDNYVKFDTALLTVNQSRNIVRTPIQGRNGTVKEYISDGDYEINVVGLIVSPYSGRVPMIDMENIHNILALQNEVVIVSNYLSLFKISYVVVEAYTFEQVEGSLNQIKFTMRLISDEPIEVQLGIDPDA